VDGAQFRRSRIGYQEEREKRKGEKIKPAVYSLAYGPMHGQDRTARTRESVRPDPKLDQNWETNGSRADSLSVWVVPLGRVFGVLLSG
jgi:hypothetical protein